jgi:hypothetical protein
MMFCTSGSGALLGRSYLVVFGVITYLLATYLLVKNWYNIESRQSREPIGVEAKACFWVHSPHQLEVPRLICALSA